MSDADAMSSVHGGGCLCGAVRFRVRGQPARNSACHCTFCQKRTGSAFGLGAYFHQDAVESLTGERKSYAHRWFKPPEGVEAFEKGTLPPPQK